MNDPSLPHARFPTLDCLGVHVALLGWPDLLQCFIERLQKPSSQGSCDNVFIVNAHTLNLAWGNPRIRDVLNSAALVLNDGIGLDIYARVHARRFAHNFVGTDLVPDLLQACSHRGVPLSVFLYGARPGRAAATAQAIGSRYSGVTIAGAVDGYESDDASVVAAVNATRPDLLLVALGNPLQEQWLARHRPALDVKVAMGVGALFDYLSGSVPRAPRVVRTLRFEWLYRFCLEPRRLFHRYVVGNPLFLWRTLRYWPPQEGNA